LPMPQFARTAGQGDSKPLFVLQSVSITGAVAIPKSRLVTAYQLYIGKKVSQADLSTISAAVGDIYREAGFHLSRAMIPPQDIQNGQLHLQVVEGSITEVALKGDGAEQFGIRPMLDAVLAERPSRLSTLERQLLLINGRPGVRIEDTALEEIGAASGHFRLIVSLKTWHLFSSVGVDNLGSSSVGPWQSYGTAAFNSYLAPGDSLVVNLSTTPGDPRQLAFGRLSYEAPVGTDGVRIGASGYYSEVRPGDFRRLFNDTIKTEWFEIRGSIVPLQSQKSSLILTAAAGFSNAYENDIFGPIYADHIRTVSLTSDYRLQDNFGGNNYLTVNYRQGIDVFGASHRADDYLSREGKILRIEFLVHALPDALRYMVVETCFRRSDSVRPALHLAAILSRWLRVRTRLRQRRDQRRQWYRRLGRTALRPEDQLSISQRLSALRLCRHRPRLERRLPPERWPFAHLGRRRRPVLPDRRTAGGHWHCRAAQLSRAR